MKSTESYLLELQRWKEEVRERLSILQMQQQQRLQDSNIDNEHVNINNKAIVNDPADSETCKKQNEENEVCNGTNQDEDEKSLMDNKSMHESAKQLSYWESLEETPIKSGNTIPFEELVEKRLRDSQMMSEDKSSSKSINNPSAKQKRPFLKKGSGLQRYYSASPNNHKTNKNATQKAVPVRRRSCLAAFSSQNNSCKKSPPKKRLVKKVAVTSASSTSLTTFPKGNKKKPDDDKIKLDRTTKGDAQCMQCTEDESLLQKGSIQKLGESNQIQTERMSTMNLLQSDTQDAEVRQQLETLQLAEFELLEEVADNTSLNSSSSFVQSLVKTTPGMLANKCAVTNSEILNSVSRGEILENRLETLQRLLDTVEQKQEMLLDGVNYTCTWSSSPNSLVEIDDQPEILNLSEVEDSDQDSDHELVSAKSKRSVHYSDRVEVHEYTDEDSISTVDNETDIIVQDLCSQYENDIGKGNTNSQSYSLRHEIMASTDKKTTVLDQLHFRVGTSTSSNISSFHDGFMTPSISNNHGSIANGPESRSSKTEELEELICQFREENQKLTKLREEYEEAVKELHMKNRVAQTDKDEQRTERRRLEEEWEVFRQEKRLYEKYLNNEKDRCPKKEDHERIKLLEKEITTLQEKMEEEEKKWSSECRRLRSRNAFLEKDHKMLKAKCDKTEEEKQELLGKLNALKKKLNNRTPAVCSKYTALRLNNCSNSQSNVNVVLSPLENQEENDVGRIEKEAMVKEKPSKSILKPSPLQNGKDVEDRCKPTAVDETVLPVSPLWLMLQEQSKAAGPEVQNARSKVRFELPPQEPLAIAAGDNEKENDVQEGEPKSNKETENASITLEQEVVSKNGTRTCYSADGRTVTVHYYNGDVKKVLDDKTEIIHYAENKTVMTTYPNGLRILEFQSGQIERHHPSGVKHITFPGGNVTIMNPNGSQETHLSDGTIVRTLVSGLEILEYSNGQREIRAKDYKRKEYPSGTVKTLYANGRQETKYASGRMRIKDKDGTLIADYKI